MKTNYSLENLIVGLKKPEEKLLPAFRRLVDEGKVTLADILKCRDMGKKGTCVTLDLIGYKIKDGPEKGTVTLERGESRWF